ncbi:hypothetical protein F4779DRAFT_577955 [Xylariaceae sp. FL0662B]|nr:hypothetical protein F4779DRAFT_577955 [Xylariaceae sp. FL0662B]
MTPLSHTLLLGLSLAASGLAAGEPSSLINSVNYNSAALQSSDCAADTPDELLKRDDDPSEVQGSTVEQNCVSSDVRCKDEWFELCKDNGKWAKWLRCKTGCLIEKGVAQCYPEDLLQIGDVSEEEQYQLRSTPSDLASDLATQACRYMDFRCVGNTMEVCNRTAGWSELLHCSKRCYVDKDNKPTCEHGNEDGSEAHFITTLESVSATNVSNQCNYGDLRCKGNLVEFCYTNGTFLKVFECQNGCKIDQGSLQCYINTTSTVATAEFLTSTTLVTAQCPVGEERCHNNDIEHCRSGSGWTKIQDCKHGCRFQNGTAKCEIEDRSENSARDLNSAPFKTLITAAHVRNANNGLVVRADNCTHGSVRCSGNNADGCMNGIWTKLQDCPSCEQLGNSSVSCLVKGRISEGVNDIKQSAASSLRPIVFIWLGSLLRWHR